MAEDIPKKIAEAKEGENPPPSSETEDPGARAEERLGEVLAGKWTLRRVLGVGGMAAVYEAEHRNRSRVAIKMLHREVSRDANVTRRFRQEGYAGNSIQHPGVLRVLDDDTAEDGSAFLVMDLLIGSSLEDILVAHPRLEPVFVAQFADEVLDILEAAHAREVIHRDVKPDNIYITAAGEVKLLDFGIASVRQSSKKTTMGSFMGTPAFCPPEQARGRWSEVDHRSDLWALGATMFTALTGHAVHEGETITEVLALAVQSRAPKVHDIAPDAHPELAALIDHALQYEKPARFQTAAEFRKALHALEAVLPPSDLGLEHLVDRTTISETSGTLMRRPKRGFRTPDGIRSSGGMSSPERPIGPGDATRIGLGAINMDGPASASVAGSPRSAVDPRATAVPTTVSGHPAPKPKGRRGWAIAALVAAGAAAVAGFTLGGAEQEPESAEAATDRLLDGTEADKNAAPPPAESDDVTAAIEERPEDEQPAVGATREAEVDPEKKDSGDDATTATPESQKTAPSAQEGATPKSAASQTTPTPISAPRPPPTPKATGTTIDKSGSTDPSTDASAKDAPTKRNEALRTRY